MCVLKTPICTQNTEHETRNEKHAVAVADNKSNEMTPYCTITTLGSQGVMCDGRERCQVKFTGEKLM
jgi:hypothetical protein